MTHTHKNKQTRFNTQAFHSPSLGGDRIAVPSFVPGHCPIDQSAICQEYGELGATWLFLVGPPDLLRLTFRVGNTNNKTGW